MATPQERFDALLKSMADLDEDKKCFRGMIFGVGGSGKTITAMRIAQLITEQSKQIAYVDTFEGMKILLDPHWKAQRLHERVRRIQYEGLSQIETLSLAIQADKLPFGTVVLDEASTMQDRDLRIVHTDHVKRGVKDTDPDNAGWPQYFAEKNRFLDMLDALYKARINVILIAHRREDINAAKQTLINPAFLPSLQTGVLRPLDICGYMTASVTNSGTNGQPQYERNIQVHPTKLITGPLTKIHGMPFSVTPDSLIKAVAEWMKDEPISIPNTPPESSPEEVAVFV